MINFSTLTTEDFLNDYWQKKPLLIKNALPEFKPPMDVDEIAGLSMEEDIESRMVFNSPHQKQAWQLKKGPFSDEDLKQLANSHWTLLVQGVDRVMPQVSFLLKHFDFIPNWRFDDVMISIAAKEGGVGPHFDNYDVFLYQASGQRKWALTTKDCDERNVIEGLDLRIMKTFEVEQEIILEQGDMLYLPAHVGHHGVSLSDNSVGYSFGYRSYQAQEIWDSYADFLSEQAIKTLYQDANWSKLESNGEIPKSAYLQAKILMQNVLDDEDKLQQWFTRFATQLDQSQLNHLAEPLTDDEAGTMDDFVDLIDGEIQFYREPCSRIAYHYDKNKQIHLFINGEQFPCLNVDVALIKLMVNQRLINASELHDYLDKTQNRHFLYELWKKAFLLLA